MIHWSEYHFHRQGNKGTCPNLFSYSMASSGHVNPGGLTPISGIFANTGMKRLSSSSPCPSWPGQADPAAGSTPLNVLNVLLRRFKQQKISQVPLIHHLSMAGPVLLVCAELLKLPRGSPSSNMVHFVPSTNVPEWFPLLTWNSRITPQSKLLRR